LSGGLFSFRWDVDHHACVTDGLPLVRQVCRDLRVPNTFFVNMGRSTNLAEWLKGASRTRQKLTDRESVSLAEKAGWARVLAETVRARPVGLSFVRDLAALQDDGHELGLHGGMDHVRWSRRFDVLPESVLEADVGESLGHFRRHFGEPHGFSSPGFRADRRTAALVERLGFAYDGDRIGGAPGPAEVDGTAFRHWTVPVTICGPRTIPFLEWHGARGTPEDRVMAELDRALDRGGIAVLYGHPCYEGVRVDLLRRVFEKVLARGFRFVTHREIVAAGVGS
jgi:peptidoglycan/xylan/chitin deacetylase (PgdA/CDA1 family)